MADDGDGARGAEERRARRDAAVERFTHAVATPRRALEAGAFEIARAIDPRTDDESVVRARAELDRLADGVTDLAGLVARLYVEEGFGGAGERYYDPARSSLLEVLAVRRGIPITLAVVCLEVGRRAGVALEPVGMPGHFLVRPAGTTGPHVDPFTGELLDLAGCEARFRSSTGAGPDVAFDPARMLVAVDDRAVLVRMLTNLRLIHRAHGRLDELRWVLAMRLALPGVGPDEVAELAEVLGRRAAFREAAMLLEDWADELPESAATLQRRARAWRAHLN